MKKIIILLMITLVFSGWGKRKKIASNTQNIRPAINLLVKSHIPAGISKNTLKADIELVTYDYSNSKKPVEKVLVKNSIKELSQSIGKKKPINFFLNSPKGVTKNSKYLIRLHLFNEEKNIHYYGTIKDSKSEDLTKGFSKPLYLSVK